MLCKFSDLIWTKFSLNITSYSTISSLTFAIYRCHYLIEDTIPQISGQVYDDIQIGYTGGATDMYIPTNMGASDGGDDLFSYDVCVSYSLYPNVMMNNKLPCGNITYFEGNILNIKPDASLKTRVLLLRHYSA